MKQQIKAKSWEVLRNIIPQADGTTKKGGTFIVDEQGMDVAYVPVHSAKANARLLAAAPELLGELKRMTDIYATAMKNAGVTYYPEALFDVRRARAAIAKAKGGEG